MDRLRHSLLLCPERRLRPTEGVDNALHAVVRSSAIPDGARQANGEWIFELPRGGPEPLLKALIDGGAGIETLSIERPGLHDAFVAIAVEAAAGEMGDSPMQAEAA